MTQQFTIFSQLPPELQTHIWYLAIPVFDNRQIRMAIHYKASVTKHSCYAETRRFCGRHGTCERPVEDTPWKPAVCMIDGYFALSPDFPGMNMAFRALLLNFQLACREACKMVRKQYSSAMKVYEEKWHPGVRFRILRCDPANDVLIVMNAHSELDTHVPPGQEQYAPSNISTLTAQERKFPQDRQQFDNFRRVLSSFKNAAFRHVDEVLLRTLSFDPPPPGRSLSPVAGNDLEILSLYMESRENFYLWMDPDSFPEVQISGRKRIEDLAMFRDRESGNSVVMYHDAMAVLNSYRAGAEAARRHYISTAEHWTPKPRDIEKVGCYIPASWLGLITFE
ncbi:unnamed protein product [Clonostachys chloroleuca]|uniref:2EXR domain-containing protein n=1 Tax=Clonostachys chloroleuca TaxID=1926264 RepID=A0AA35Q0K9_9HYPO|nr:unnamed protein product [Clonostachys chloroleuca]